MKNFNCKHCNHSVLVEKFAFRARAHSPINCTPFSVVELNCPDCHTVNASVVVPAGMPLEELPKLLESALDNVAKYHYHLCENVQDGAESDGNS